MTILFRKFLDKHRFAKVKLIVKYMEENFNLTYEEAYIRVSRFWWGYVWERCEENQIESDFTDKEIKENAYIIYYGENWNKFNASNKPLPICLDSTRIYEFLEDDSVKIYINKIIKYIIDNFSILEHEAQERVLVFFYRSTVSDINDYSSILHTSIEKQAHQIIYGTDESTSNSLKKLDFLPLSNNRYSFITDAVSRSYIDRIVEKMSILFNISFEEAIKRANEYWFGTIIGEPFCLLYHEGIDYWANCIFYEDNNWWQTPENDRKVRELSVAKNNIECNFFKNKVAYKFAQKIAEYMFDIFKISKQEAMCRIELEWGNKYILNTKYIRDFISMKIPEYWAHEIYYDEICRWWQYSFNLIRKKDSVKLR